MGQAHQPNVQQNQATVLSALFKTLDSSSSATATCSWTRMARYDFMGPHEIITRHPQGTLYVLCDGHVFLDAYDAL